MKRLFFTILALATLTATTSAEALYAGKKPKSKKSEQPAESTAGALIANGQSEATYDLIIASGYNYETPDTSKDHATKPFQHIQQSWDKDLNKWVFDFHIHAAIDDDRGKANVTDRQRNEIKTDHHSPASMVGQEGETMVMRWKFRLPEGMQATKNFCHIHQLKGMDNKEGTADVSTPTITFTVRRMSNGKQQLQVIYMPPKEEGGGNTYLARVDLNEFLGEWVEVEERITCGTKGKYEVQVARIRDGRTLISVPTTQVVMWRSGTTGMRPKWGIYRSIGKMGVLIPELRDEVLHYADFSIEKK